ncbi:hypothetical protein ACFXD5_19230 [Streptomyces sp. NPDC059385]|uniref:hypothetical protein n=1 Tax=Streptomyces sp. NPDC059385 TaxID=3346817 RepID=UPI003697B7E3
MASGRAAEAYLVRGTPVHRRNAQSPVAVLVVGRSMFCAQRTRAGEFGDDGR